MSLNYLGIAHSPPLHRQLSSPAAGHSSKESSPCQDVTQDSKDVLIDRLNDLVLRISNANVLQGSHIAAVHAEVDLVELLLRDHEKSPKSSPILGEAFEAKGRMDSRDDIFWGPPTPTRSMRMRFPDKPSSPLKSPFQPKKPTSTLMNPSRAAEVAEEAEKLANNLSDVVSELQRRREEAAHIHDIHIMKLEAAAQRIISLEKQVADMDDSFEANQAELQFLRIQLQAIEAQSSLYKPRDEDPELTQSIMNWKIDCENISKRMKARKKPNGGSTSSTAWEKSRMTVDSVASSRPRSGVCTPRRL